MVDLAKFRRLMVFVFVENRGAKGLHASDAFFVKIQKDPINLVIGGHFEQWIGRVIDELNDFPMRDMWSGLMGRDDPAEIVYHCKNPAFLLAACADTKLLAFDFMAAREQAN